MAESRESARIQVREEVGKLLMLRSNVAPVFRKASRFGTRRVIMDFTGVEFMSRSFADEYLSAKTASTSRIEEKGLSTEVKQMLKLVSARRAAPRSSAQRKERRLPPAHVTTL